MPRKSAETGKGPEQGASTAGGRRGAKRPDGTWTFVSNHLLVLLCIAEDPGMRIADVAQRLQITERAVHAIVADLVESGYLTRTRVGRRNQYQIDRRMPLRHLETQHRLLGDLLALLFHGEGAEAGLP
jgi:DNA-binding MarR family transcriptional regulator